MTFLFIYQICFCYKPKTIEKNIGKKKKNLTWRHKWCNI